MKLGDLVRWTDVTNQNYFSYNQNNFGILLKEIEQYDHWILAKVLDNFCEIKIVMLHKKINPL